MATQTLADLSPGRRLFWGSVAAWTLLHVILAIMVPVSGDEAYYWDCARHPDWSSFDQPLLMMWTMNPFRWVLGETSLAVRGPAITASLLIAVFLLGLIRRLGGGYREAAAAYTILHGMPFFFIGAFYQSTDIGMAAAYLAATWAAVAIAQGERRAWWTFGLATGLGFLAKYPTVLIVPAILPALMSRHARRDLRAPTPWLAALVAFAMTTPVWIWALEHNWDNILFQTTGRHETHGIGVKYLGEFIGANLALATPFLAIAMVIALWLFASRAGADRWVVVVAAVMPFAFFGFVSLQTRVGAHWGGPALLVAAAVLAITKFRARRLLIGLGMAMGLVLSVTLVGVAAFPEQLIDLDWSYAGRPDRISTRALARIVGNEQIAYEIGQRLLPDEALLMTSYSDVHLYGLLSDGELPARLAHITGGSHGLASLYWHEKNDLVGKNALVVTEKENVAETLAGYCREVEPLDPIEVIRIGEVMRTVELFRCVEITRDDGAFTR